MNMRLWSTRFGLWCALAAPGTASAQAPTATGPALQPSRRPTVSPYLSLLGGNSPAGQYYRQVRPDLQFYQTGRELQDVTRQLRTEIQATQQEFVQSRPLSDLTPTGYPAGFLTHQRYFNRFPAGPGSGLAGSGPGLRRPPPRRR